MLVIMHFKRPIMPQSRPVKFQHSFTAVKSLKSDLNFRPVAFLRPSFWNEVITGTSFELQKSW